MVHRDVETDTLPFCLREGIGAIVYSPTASGLLTGAMTRERAAALPENDWRHNHPDFNPPKLSRNLALVERLREIGKRQDRSPGEVAISWTLVNPAVTGATPAQAEGVMRAGDLRLSEEEVDEIEASLGSVAA